MQPASFALSPGICGSLGTRVHCLTGSFFRIKDENESFYLVTSGNQPRERNAALRRLAFAPTKVERSTLCLSSLNHHFLAQMEENILVQNTINKVPLQRRHIFMFVFFSLGRKDLTGRSRPDC